MKNIFITIHKDRISLLYQLIVHLQKKFKIHLLLLSGELSPLEIKYYQEENIEIYTIPYHKIFHLKKILYYLENNKNSINLFFLEKLYFFYEYFIYLFIENLIKKNRYIIHISYGSTNWIESMVVKSFDDYNIKTLVPYFMIQPGLFYNQSIYSSNDLLYMKHSKSTLYEKTTFNKFNQAKYPYQSINGYFRLLPHLLNSLLNQKALPLSPFILGGYNSPNTIICQNHLAGINAIRKFGIQESNICLIGDVQAEKLYSSFLKKPKNYKDQKIILVALTQFSENQYLDKEKTKEEHNFIIKTLSSIQNVKVLISLHPVMYYKDYKYLEKKYNCKITKKNLSEILPLCDLFVSAFSNTLLWALKCGIPAINLDYYNWEWDKKIIERYEHIYTIQNRENLYNVSLNLLTKPLNFTMIHKQLNLNKIFNNNILNDYEKIINENSNNNPIKFVKNKFFINYIFKILNYYENKKETKNMEMIKKAYYISPYSDSTIKLLTFIKNIKPELEFLGFLDNYKSIPNLVISPKDADKNKLVIIGNSKFKNEIKKSLLAKNFKHIYNI